MMRDVSKPRGARGAGQAFHHPLFARFYDAVNPAMERAGLASLRRELLDGLRGEVIEVGAGSGASFPHYPREVTRVVAVEPEPHLRRLARERAAQADVPIEVVAGTAEDLAFADGSFDAAVVMLVLCSVREPEVAVAQLRRVLRPGGEIRALEHVRADTPGLRRVQRVLDATVWPLLAGGCHTHRDPLATLEAAGFAADRVERFRFPDGPVALPTSPHVAAVASR